MLGFIVGKELGDIVGWPLGTSEGRLLGGETEGGMLGTRKIEGTVVGTSDGRSDGR